jgi:hypothetical protein
VDAVYIIHLDDMADRATALTARLTSQRATLGRAALGGGAIKVGPLPDPVVPAWPLPDPILWSATDGRDTDPLAAAIQSWIGVLQDAQDNEYGDIIVCEDDVLWADDFAARYPDVEADLPTGWGFFLLGGRAYGAPSQVTPRLISAPSFGGTYALGIAAAQVAPLLAFVRATPGDTWGVTVRQYLAANGLPAYIASPPLCGHDAGTSTLNPNNVYPDDSWWPNA